MNPRWESGKTGVMTVQNVVSDGSKSENENVFVKPSLAMTVKSTLLRFVRIYHLDLKKQGDLRKFLILLGGTPLWHEAQ